MNLKGLVEFVSLGLISLRSSKEVEHRDIFGREIEYADEFFHPQKFRGIPMFDADSILRHYGPQLKRLREVIDIGDHRMAPSGRPLFDELYVDVLKRFVTFVHMIPASEDHHHSHTGGLLTHSIEASIESLRWSRELKCHMTDMPDLNTQIKPVIDYCAWLGGLCHDVGKIMRDISVDAVEVIHPVTKRPIPMTKPILSWHPQKESLIQWARDNKISAYHVTWLRHRTHNRHNIDSGQILQPLLNGTYAMDYILSSPIRQELYSELARCLSGFSHQKGHLPDCIRMGDSVSTNKALSIQYDPVRGHRRVSTATKLYHCINIARRDWEWNMQKSRGWVIGGDVYLRWSSAIDSIVHASVDNQFGLPTDTRSILTIMESNGFSHLFSQDCTNDRIIKFTPGEFTQKQIQEIITGRAPVSWLDLIKIVTPNVIFGENPVPPSMSGVVLLPNAKQFYFVSKDGEIDLLTPLLPPTEQARDNSNHPTHVAHSSGQVPPLHASAQISLPAPTVSEKPTTKPPASPKKAQSKKVDADKKPQPVDMLPKPAAKKSALNNELFGDDIEEQVSTNSTPNTELVTHKENEHAQPGDAVSSENSESDIATPESDSKSAAAPAVHKGLKTSVTLTSIIDMKVKFYKTKKDILVDASHAESILEKSLQEILQSLKATSELKQNLMSPNVLTAFHEVDGQKIKCIPIEPKFHLLFEHADVPATSIMDQGGHQEQKSVIDSKVSDDLSVNENANNPPQSVKEKIDRDKKGGQEQTSITENSAQTSVTENSVAPKKRKNSKKEQLAPVAPGQDSEKTSFIPAPQNDCINLPTLAIPIDVSLASNTDTPADDMHVGQPESGSGAENHIAQENSTSVPPDDFQASLNALAGSISTDTLLHFLMQIDSKQLVQYGPDGRIEINLGAVSSDKYKPVGKSRILIDLVNSAGIREGQKIVIGLDDLLKIKVGNQI